MLGTGHPLRTHRVSIPSSDLTPRRKWEGHGLSTCSQGLGGRGRSEGSFFSSVLASCKRTGRSSLLGATWQPVGFSSVSTLCFLFSSL